jgi:alpha-D-xyloside xylohydrolase
VTSTPAGQAFIGFVAVETLLLVAIPGVSAGQTLTGEFPRPTPMQVVQTAGGFKAHNDREEVDVTICGESRIHVVARPIGASAPSESRPWILDKSVACPGESFQFSQSGDATSLTTARLSVLLSAAKGQLSFKTADGAVLLGQHRNLPRTYDPVGGTGLYHVEERFSPDALEAIYGLGQHQSGVFNYRGSTVELGQNNTDVAIPLLLSSKGWGILWNTASFTWVDNRFPVDLSFESMATDQIDYYVLYGLSMDSIIHEYRSMTGHVHLFPEWG